MHLSKSIRLSDEAYDRLAARKREDETFSDVVMRLAGERSLLELAGVLTDELEAAIEELASDGTRVGDSDVSIGATARIIDEPVLARNIDDFERLEGVEVESY